MVSRALLTAGLLAITAAALPAQSRPFTFRPTGVEIGASGDGIWTLYPSRDEATHMIAREWIAFGLRGSVLSPRFFAFDALVRPTWIQYQTDNTLGQKDRMDGAEINYRGSAGLFRGRLFSLAVDGSRFSGSSPGGFGQSTEFRYADWTGSVFLQAQALPTEVGYEHHDIVETAVAPGTVDLARQDATVRRLYLKASNSKLRLDASRLSLEDRLDGQDYDLDQGLLFHNVRWGKGSRLLTTLTHYKRTLSGAYEQQTWREGLHLQHTRVIASDVTGGVRRNSSLLGRITTRDLDGALSAYPLPGLLVTIGGRAQRDELPTGRSDYSALGGRASYSAQTRSGFQFAAGAVLEREHLRQDATISGDIPVVNERHVVPSSGRFLLDNGNVVPASLVVSDMTETTVYQAGFDYQSFESAGTLEVVVLPTGRIAVGDTLLVDYRFTAFPSGDTNAWVTQGNLTLGWRALQVYYNGFRRSGAGSGAGASASGLTGFALNIADRSDQTVGARLALNLAGATVNLGADRSQRTWTGSSFTGTSVRGSASWQLLSWARLTAGGDWSRGGDEDFTRTAQTGNVTVEWQLLQRRHSSLMVRTTARGWSWTETPGNRESLLGAIFEADLTVEKLRVRGRYEYNNWDWTIADREQRAFFWFSRGFW